MARAQRQRRKLLVAGIPVVMSASGRSTTPGRRIFPSPRKRRSARRRASLWSAITTETPIWWRKPFSTMRTSRRSSAEADPRRRRDDAGREMAQAIARLKVRITVAPNADDGFFELHVRDTDAIRARETVQLLLNEFVSRNVSRNQQALQEAEKHFLDAQLANLPEHDCPIGSAHCGFPRTQWRRGDRYKGGARRLRRDADTDTDERGRPRHACHRRESRDRGAGGGVEGQARGAESGVHRRQYPDVIAAQRLPLAEAVAQKSRGPHSACPPRSRRRFRPRGRLAAVESPRAIARQPRGAQRRMGRPAARKRGAAHQLPAARHAPRSHQAFSGRVRRRKGEVIR